MVFKVSRAFKMSNGNFQNIQPTVNFLKEFQKLETSKEMKKC